MRMTESDARRAGEMSQQFIWTDEELALVLSATKLTVAFLGGKGPCWSLALSPLRQELERLEGFIQSRKRQCKGGLLRP